MLFRAVFWIGVVALLVPSASEPGVRSGLRFPGGGSAVATAAVKNLQDVLLDHLAAVKADIEAAERSRADQGG